MESKMSNLRTLSLLITLVIFAACSNRETQQGSSNSSSDDTAGKWYNALPDEERAKGITPLMWASNYGDIARVKALLSKGADVNARDTDGWTALHHAALGGDGPMSPALGSSHSQVMQALISAGADVNAKTKEGEMALTMAAAKGQSEWVKVLLQNGADVNAKNSLGETSLIAAASKGHSDEDAEATISLLLQAGADVNQKDLIGWTALQYAKSLRRYRIIQLLQAAGAKK
jgi:ankyrin repeat protein